MAGMKREQQHGLSKHPLYKLWLNVKDRCNNPKNPYFHNYGGRGIRMCQEWQDSFPAFMAGIGPRPSLLHTLDRKENDGHYEPGNVTWATKREQANNQRKNRRVTLDGRTQTIAEWARELGLAPSTVHNRLARGRPVELALTPIKYLQVGRCR